jgi:hypothetical protein
MIYVLYTMWVLKHIADTISYILTKNNIKNEVVTSFDPVKDETKNNDLWICIWTNGSFKIPKKCITYNTEPLRVGSWMKDLSDKFNKSSLIFEYAGSHMEIYKEQNLLDKVIHIPYGYCEIHEELYRHYAVCKSEKEKDIDILYYGALTPRRINVVNQINKMCRENKYNFCVRDNTLYDYKEKANLVSRSRIILSITRDEPDKYGTNDSFRLAYLISNKAFVLAEEIGDKLYEDEMKRAIIFYNGIEDLLNKIKYYMDNEVERLNIAQNGYNFMKDKYNMNNMLPIKKILELEK